MGACDHRFDGEQPTNAYLASDGRVIMEIVCPRCGEVLTFRGRSVEEAGDNAVVEMTPVHD